MMKTIVGNQPRSGNATNLPSCVNAQMAFTVESEKGV